jgi:hypothetical protein
MQVNDTSNDIFWKLVFNVSGQSSLPLPEDMAETNKPERGAICDSRRNAVSEGDFPSMIPKYLFSSGTSQCFCQSSASESQDKEAEKV